MQVHKWMFPGLGEPYLGEGRHFILTRYTFLTPSSAYSSYNHHPIAPHRGQTTVPGYILDVSRPWGAVPGRKTPFYPDALHVSDTVFCLFLINHHPIAPHRGQTTVPGYILDMLRPTFDPPQTTLGCPPSHIPQCATHPAMYLEHIPLLPLLFGSLSSRSAVAHVQFAFHKNSRNKGV